MGGKKAKSAPVPDYSNLARQQADAARAAAERQTESNRINQSGPGGDLTWSKDPTTGQWTQTVTQGATGQAADALYRQQLEKLQGQGEFGGYAGMPTYDPNSGQATSDALYESVMGRARGEQAKDTASLENKLRMQGLQPGSEAYNRAMQNLMTSQGDVSTQAALQAQLAGGQESRNIYQTQLAGQQQGYNQALQNYQMPWQQAGISQGLAQGSQPQFQDYYQATGYNPEDQLGAAQAGYLARQNAANASNSKKSSGMGNLSNLGSAAITTFSDAALKGDITPVSLDKLLDLTPVEWKWEGSGVRDYGVIAQQVQEQFPELVEKHKSGYLQVNYSALCALLLAALKEATNGH